MNMELADVYYEIRYDTVWVKTNSIEDNVHKNTKQRHVNGLFSSKIEMCLFEIWEIEMHELMCI